ncbi:hypothetical protein B0H14DRAFT_3440730 [Mycena olivaceomarginata]|nr:hypothetical protein B0H14DRAFT_3440730 [Mycena olivaceomarginata]
MFPPLFTVTVVLATAALSLGFALEATTPLHLCFSVAGPWCRFGHSIDEHAEEKTARKGSEGRAACSATVQWRAKRMPGVIWTLLGLIPGPESLR